MAEWSARIDVLRVSPPPIGPSPTPLLALAFDRDGKHVAAGSVGRILLAGVESTRFVARETFVSGSKAHLLCFSSGLEFLAAAERGSVLVGPLGPEKKVLEPSHRMPVVSLNFSGDEKVLASSGADRVLHVWSPATGKSMRTLEVAAQPATRLTLSSDGSILAALVEGQVRLWSLQDGSPVSSIKSPTTILSLALSPDGKQLATGCQDGTVRFWEVATGKEQERRVAPQLGPVTRVQFTPDGRTLLAVGAASPVYLFDLQSGRQLIHLLYQGRLKSTAFSSDGMLLAIGTESLSVGTAKIPGEVQVWKLGPVTGRR
jgi:WD40 repeat protein